MKKATLTLLCLFLSIPCYARTITIKPDGAGDYPTIQAAIDAANDGDVIVLTPGTYTGPGNRDIDYLGKTITVRSTDPNDPNIVATTVINCQGTIADRHRGFNFLNGEDANSILYGLTITGGYAERGGAIHCNRSSPTIKHCVFEYNREETQLPKWGGGGAIYNYRSCPIIINCILRHNHSKEFGGGIFNTNNSSPILIKCIFKNNSTTWEGYGGGMANDGGCNPELIDCNFTGNLTYSCGGAISNLFDCSPKLTNCVITNNRGYIRGGGIYNQDSSNPVLTNCMITDNWSSFEEGGGIYNQSSSPKLINCTITGNFSERSTGGGIFNWGIENPCNPELINCNIIGNSPCGIYTQDGLTGQGANFTSSPILKNCIVWENWGQTESYQINGGNPVLNYCCVQGWTGALGGEGNIGLNPELIDNYYHLKTSSPCINAGDPYGDYTGQTDIDGQPRVIGSCVDIGVDEHLYGDIQEAIYAAEDGDTIIVAPGTYNENICFSGKNLTLTTTDPNNPAATVIKALHNAPVVTFIDGQEANCVMTGFTITDGNAENGGGICCQNSSPTLANCIIKQNSADDGAGICCLDHSSPTIVNCIFTENTSNICGGAIFSDTYSIPTITNCTISQNSAYVGGAIYSSGRLFKITNSILWGNSADFNSGIYGRANVNYSNVQGGWPGQGNIDADPCFVDPAGGDYHLLADSPCIDAGDPDYVADPNETDLDGNPRIIDGTIDMGALEYLPPLEARLLIMPRTINRINRQRYIIAWLSLPAEVTRDDIDENVPLTLYPGDIEASRQFIFENNRYNNPGTFILAFFNKSDLMNAVPEDGQVLLEAVGQLNTGRYFFGQRTIRIINPPHDRGRRI